MKKTKPKRLSAATVFLAHATEAKLFATEDWLDDRLSWTASDCEQAAMSLKEVLKIKEPSAKLYITAQDRKMLAQAKKLAALSQSSGLKAAALIDKIESSVRMALQRVERELEKRAKEEEDRP